VHDAKTCTAHNFSPTSSFAVKVGAARSLKEVQHVRERAARQPGCIAFRAQHLAATARIKVTPAKKGGPHDPQLKPMAEEALPKTVTKRSKSGREENAAVICEDICNIVKNYKIDSGDNSLPKLTGLLRACGRLVTKLVEDIKEPHLTQGISNELFYTSMVLEHEGKESLRRFMLKSAKGRDGKDENKILSLQKLYKMNCVGEGFLAKIEHVEPRTYKKKRKSASSGESERKIRTQLEKLVTEIGFESYCGQDGKHVWKKDDYDAMVCDWDESREHRNAKSLLERVEHFRFELAKADAEVDSAQKNFRKSASSFKKQYKSDNTLEDLPDTDDDGYNDYMKAKKAACKKELDKLDAWQKTKASSVKALDDATNIIEKQYLAFNSLKDDLKKFRDSESDLLDHTTPKKSRNDKYKADMTDDGE